MTVAQLITEFDALYVIQNFIAVITKAHQWSLY